MNAPVSATSDQGSIAETTRLRLTRLRDQFALSKVDALLVTRDADIEYFSDFCGHDSWMLVTEDKAVIISDHRYDEQLNSVREGELIDVVMGVRHRLELALHDLVERNRIGRLGLQADHLTVAEKSVLVDKIDGVALVDTTGLVGNLRIRKDEQEIAAIQDAISINQAALSATLEQLTLGMREREVSAVLEYEIKMRGGDGCGFKPIVAVGAHGSLPHYETADAPIEEGQSLLVDWGTSARGYQSDLTRTFGLNAMPPKVREIYQIVLDAQLAAIEACRPGAICADVDKVARDLITDAGYGAYFGHGLGHGMGKDVHEPPYFNSLETSTRLEPGVVMTVEPGIYLPGVGGVRIEDDVLITATGHRVLSQYPKELDDAILRVASA